MIGRSRVRSVPVEFAIGLIDRKIVNGCVTMLHETVIIELPRAQFPEMRSDGWARQLAPASS
jgi:hypothetical protein